MFELYIKQWISAANLSKLLFYHPTFLHTPFVLLFTFNYHNVFYTKYLHVLLLLLLLLQRRLSPIVDLDLKAPTLLSQSLLLFSGTHRLQLSQRSSTHTLTRSVTQFMYLLQNDDTLPRWQKILSFPPSVLKASP